MKAILGLLTFMFLPWLEIREQSALLSDLKFKLDREERLKNMYQGDSRTKGAEAMRLRRDLREAKDLVKTWEGALTRGYLAYMTMNNVETRISPTGASPPGSTAEGFSGWRRPPHHVNGSRHS